MPETPNHFSNLAIFSQIISFLKWNFFRLCSWGAQFALKKLKYHFINASGSQLYAFKTLPASFEFIHLKNLTPNFTYVSWLHILNFPVEAIFLINIRFLEKNSMKSKRGFITRMIYQRQIARIYTRGFQEED